MERLTKRTPNGIAYMAIADTLSKREQEIEGSKPILEGLYAIFQKLADFEDREEPKKVTELHGDGGYFPVCHMHNIDVFQYCNRCGQKLKWD